MHANKYVIKTLINDVRMSTQELLQLINTKINEGITEFEIEACGQHNIGIGGKYKSSNLTFHITNPGQELVQWEWKGQKL